MIVYSDDLGELGYVVYGLRQSGYTEFRYIGLTTTSVRQRAKEHTIMTTHNHRYALYKWLRKHTSDEIEMVPLSRCVQDSELLKQLEVFWIQHYRGLGHRLLNGTAGGDGILHLSAESRKKLSDAAKLRIGPRSSMFGRKYSEEERTKKSLQQLGKANVGTHTRWHLGRGLKSDTCFFCTC